MRATACALKKAEPLPAPDSRQSIAGGSAPSSAGAAERKAKLATSEPAPADVGSSTGAPGGSLKIRGGPSAAGASRKGRVAFGRPACEMETTSATPALESAAAEAIVSTPLVFPTIMAPAGALVETMANVTVPFAVGAPSGKITSSASEGARLKGGAAPLIGTMMAPAASVTGGSDAFTIATASVAVAPPSGYSSSVTMTVAR